jgi:polar amino acid transport system substrate-binding protein
MNEEAGPGGHLRRLNMVILRWCLVLPLVWQSALLPKASATSEHLTPFTIAASLNRSAMTMDIEQKLTQAYRDIGYQLNIQYLPAERSIKMSNQGKFDGELFRIAAISQQYPHLIQVPVALANITLYAFVKTGREHEFGRWQLEPSLRIGFVRGFKLAELYEVAGYKIIVNTPGQAVQMLQQGKIDILLEDLKSLREATAGNEQDAQLNKLPEILAQEELFHFVHQRHQQLIPALSAQLKLQIEGKKRKKSVSGNGGDQKYP